MTDDNLPVDPTNQPPEPQLPPQQYQPPQYPPPQYQPAPPYQQPYPAPQYPAQPNPYGQNPYGQNPYGQQFAPLPGFVPFVPPQPPRRKRGRLIALLVAVVVVIAGSVTGTYLLTHDSKKAAAAKIVFPTEWDPRVLDYVAYVEKDRKLTFKHPIAVDFLSEEDFKKKVTTDQATLTDEDRKSLESTTALLRSLGLVDASFDPLKAENDLLGGSVVGFYDPDTKRMAVRGTEITLLERPTIVHELTHALQDQYFDLAGHTKKFENDKTEASQAFDAIVEGDATRIEYDYRESLSASDKAALKKDEDAQAAQAKKDVADVPEILQAMLEFPYGAGESLLALQKARSGVGSIDGLFTDPPVSTEQLLDPFTFFNHDAPITVDQPALNADETHLDDGVFGALGWYLVLAERIDTHKALEAIDGWGGDDYVTYKKGSQSCSRIAYVGDNSANVTRMQAAIQEWVAAGPAGAATLTPTDKGLTLTTCSTDSPVKSNKSSEEAIAYTAIRSQLAAQFLEQGATPVQAQCVSHKVVNAFSLEVLQSTDVSPENVAKIQAFVRSCR